MNIKKIILDTIFPIYCIFCKRENQWICEKCFDKIIIKTEQHCPLCKKSVTPNGEFCFSCKYKNDLDGILIASFYRKNKEKTLLAKIIHLYKYRFISELNLILGEILKKSILNSTLPLPEVIIPIPLHPHRLRWRGFNQSQLLAHYLGENLTPGLNLTIYDDFLIRSRNTRPQMEIKNKKNRELNTKDAFNINKHSLSSVENKTIFLVDDIVTTGSTLFECAKILKKSGAKKVFGIVLARQ